MTTFSRPGVYVVESFQQQNITPNNDTEAVAAFIGGLPKGPTTPTLITSWGEFTKTFGKLDLTVPMSVALYQFFANGGRNTYICRTTQTGAATASVTLTDSASAATLTVSAKNSGAWANSSNTSTGISVEALAYGSSRFSIVVYGPVGVTGADSRSNILEQFTDLSVSSTDARYAESVINASSAYITVADLSSSSLRPNPDGTLKALTGGSNGSGGITPAILSAALPLFDSYSDPLLMNIPDAAYFSSSDWATATNSLLTYAAGRTDSFVVADTIAAQSVADALTQVGTLTSGIYGAAYYPWITIPDTTKSISGATKNVPPGGAVIGQYQATDASKGVFKSPAGYTNRLALAVSLEKRLTNAELDQISANVPALNPLRILAGSGICIMGARTLSNVSPYQYVNVRRNLIYIEKMLTNLTRYSLFENNDSYLWNSLETTARTFLNGHWNDGGLRGGSPAQAFYVKCDSSTTSAADIAAGVVNLQVGVALQTPAEFIVINIGQTTGDATVVGY
jgi:phage tail sheath protein FI